MHVKLAGVSKRFGHVVANDDVTLELRPGEVLALLGENGAGKSTLMKVLYGHERADSGGVFIDGRLHAIDSPRAARALGIGMVFQQGSAIDRLTVLENLLLGAADVPLWRPAQRPSPARARALAELQRLAPDLDPQRPASELSAAERQLLEVAKLLWRGAKLLILDEPTSLLARPDAERLWCQLRELAARGHAVVMITHKFDDVAHAADRVVVMRAGKIVHDTRDVRAREPILRAMLGERRIVAPPVAANLAVVRDQPRLSVSELSAAAGSERIDSVSFEIGRGEILGIAGVTGNGQELLGRVIAAVATAQTGRITLDGRLLTPRERVGRTSVAYIPEQPRLHGCAAELSLLVNLGALQLRRWPWWLDLRQFCKHAAALLERFEIRPRELDRAAGTLSGGNLQKLVLARELSGEPSLVVACFPTLGLDHAAASGLQRELLAHAARGAAVLWISEDLDPLLEYADRVAVLHRGHLRGPIARHEATMARLGAWMTGVEA